MEGYVAEVNLAWLLPFIQESNKIEGIERAPTDDEVHAHVAFLTDDELSVDSVSRFVQRVAKAELRDKPGMNVFVGGHVPIPGSEQVTIQLDAILALVKRREDHPWLTHIAYEHLHPFMDGNGRSGRAIWAWGMMRRTFDRGWMGRGFLHTFYYQTLDSKR